LFLAVLLVGVTGAQHQDKFHHSQSSPKVDYDGMLKAAVPLTASVEGRAVLDNCFQSYGGEEKLRSLNDFELTYDASSKFGQQSFKVVKSFQRGRHYKIDRRGEQRILNGKKSWFKNEDTTMDLDGGRYCAELYSYMTLAMPLAIRTERFDEIRYGTRPDDPLAYIYLDKQDSVLVVLGIDRDSHLIRSAEGIVRQGEENYVFINLFDDYQEREGFRFAGTVTTISMGLEVSKAKLTGANINPGFKDKEFKP
jgi:outer membrane lipoprotein-sorting protein